MSSRQKMENKIGKWRFISGVVVGAVLCACFTATAWAGSGVRAEPVTQTVYLDGHEVEMSGYLIADNNYVKLRDVGELLDFNVYWEDGVFLDTTSSYTGQPPDTSTPVVQLPPVDFPPEEEVDEEAVCKEIIRLTNQLRKKKGLPALVQDEKLMEAAQVRAEEMAATGVYSHTRPNGTKRVTVTDCPYTTENIHRITAQRLSNVQEELAEVAVADWSASKTHLDAMLDKKRSAIGVGIAKGVNADTGAECWYCVQWFLRSGYKVTWVDKPVLK